MLRAEGVAVEIDGAMLLPPTFIRLGAGGCVAVRGPNGAGKTTLLRVISVACGRLRDRRRSASTGASCRSTSAGARCASASQR
ncbi:MAG: ATP-binding cassette domain-containing protein [Leucobacter sp.]